MTKFEQMCERLQNKIIDAYENGVTLEDAERAAAEFLHGQLAVSAELKKASLSARMRKTGVKAVRAAIYLKEATKDSKKPSDVLLGALIDSDTIVQGEQEEYDKAEVDSDELERLYNVFREAHIFFRSVSRGRME